MLNRRFLGSFCWACLLASTLLLISATGAYAAPDGSGFKVVRRMPIGGDGGNAESDCASGVAGITNGTICRSAAVAI